MIISEMPLLIVLIFLAQTAGNDGLRECVLYFTRDQLFSTFCNVLKGESIIPLNWCQEIMITDLSPVQSSGNPDAKRLYDDIMSGYNKLVKFSGVASLFR